MVQNLKSKIFFLIMIPLSIIMIGVIVLFTFFNYRNTINTSTFFIDRFYGFEEKVKNEKPPKKDEEDDNSEIIETKSIPEIDGFYSVIIRNNQVVSEDEKAISDEIKQSALNASNKVLKTGIIGNYIYNIHEDRNDEKNVMLVENEDAVKHIKILISTSIVICLLGLIIIYIISKKISEIIVKPVEETFSKQVEFISDSSHELKTPLAVIEANADVLENEIGENKWLNYIKNEIDSMDKLINELLLLAKIENVDSINEKEEFNLSQESEICVSMFESMAFEKNVKIETHIQENVSLIGHKEDIKHILSTLLDNAIKHTESENRVEINLSKTKDNILIEVRNQGEPIAKEEREKIFERFYRVDKSRNRESKRYGLGLAIAKSTVQKYNGTIDVECSGGFTTFKVKIPV